MNWLQKISTSFSGYSKRSMPLYWPAATRPSNSGVDVYRAPKPYDNVFLGGEDENQIIEAQTWAGAKICEFVDVRNMPEFRTWTEENYEFVKNSLFTPHVHRLANIMQNKKCPIYVHCAYGMNRSVSVLSAALALLTGENINSILHSMKIQRGVIEPHDAYYLMALETSSKNPDEIQKARKMLDLQESSDQL